MTKKLIPFSRELYEKGYKAFKRSGEPIEQIFFDKNPSEDYPDGIYVYEDEKHGYVSKSFNKDGTSYDGCETDDIILEAKTIDLYIGITKTYEPYMGVEFFLTSVAFTNEGKQHIAPHYKPIIKVTLDAETLEQIV